MESTTRRIVLISILLIFALAVFLTMNFLHSGQREYYLSEEDILELKAKAQQTDNFTNRETKEKNLEHVLRKVLRK